MLRDETKAFIIGILSSFVASALYDALRYIYRRKIISSRSVSPIEKFRRLVEQTRLLSHFIIRAAKAIPLQIHTQRQAVIDFVSLKNLRMGAPLQHCLGTLGVYQFSPAIRVVVSVTLMI